MTNKEINEGNKLIAKFLGWEKYEDTETYKFPNLYPLYNISDKENTGWVSEQISNAKFHNDWSWLMPIIEKIEQTNYVKIVGNFCGINKSNTSEFNNWVGYEGGKSLYPNMSKIEATFKAVISFIKWYNKQKNRK